MFRETGPENSKLTKIRDTKKDVSYSAFLLFGFPALRFGGSKTLAVD